MPAVARSKEPCQANDLVVQQRAVRGHRVADLFALLGAQALAVVDNLAQYRLVKQRLPTEEGNADRLGLAGTPEDQVHGLLGYLPGHEAVVEGVILGHIAVATAQVAGLGQA